MNNFRKRVFQIKIREPITSRLVAKLKESLEKTSFYSPKMVALMINCSGGSLIQATMLSQVIRKYAQEKKAPLYCFGEDLVANSALALLTCGQQVFVNKYSLIGDVGYSSQQMNLQEFCKKWMISYNQIAEGQFANFLNPFKQLTQLEQDKLKYYLKGEEEELITIIENNRKDKIKEISKQIYNEGFSTAEQYKTAGIIDGCDNLDQIIQRDFNDCKVLTIFGNKRM